MSDPAVPTDVYQVNSFSYFANLNQAFQVANSPTLGTGRRGLPCLTLNSDKQRIRGDIRPGPSAVPYIGFAYKTSLLPTITTRNTLASFMNNFNWLLNLTTCYLAVTDGGKLQVWARNPHYPPDPTSDHLLAESATDTIRADGIWRYIEWFFYNRTTSNGATAVYVNGVRVAYVSGVVTDYFPDIDSSGFAQYTLGWWSDEIGVSPTTVDNNFCDLYQATASAGGTFDAPFGNVEVWPMHPVADGYYADFSGDYTEIDDPVFSGASLHTYVTSSTPDTRATYLFDALTLLPSQTLVAVQHTMYRRYPGGFPNWTQVAYVADLLGSYLDEEGSNHIFGTATPWICQHQIWNQAPQGDTTYDTWSADHFNNTQWGFEVFPWSDAGVELRVADLLVELFIMVVPVVTGARYAPQILG